MYGYDEWIDISPQQILQRVSQEEIFELVLKLPFSYNAKYKSPCREDHHPGCFFSKLGDTILFQDFGETKGKTHRSCFRMVMDSYGVSFRSAIDVICSSFGLSTNPTDYEPVSRQDRREDWVDRGEFKIDYDKKDYDRKDILYWSKFITSTNDLLEDNVHSVRRFYTRYGNNPARIITPYSHCYAYDFISSIKIYQPYSKYKWTSSCDENDIGNIDNLSPRRERLVISKSYKDHRVIRNSKIESNVIWFQNEGCVPAHHILKNLSERFGTILIFFDNDTSGIRMALKLKDIFNEIREGSSLAIWLPNRWGHKDPARFVEKEGRKDLITVLKQIGL